MRVDAVGQGEVDNTILTAEGNGRLGRVLRQDLQPAALAASKKHGYTVLFLKIHKQVPPSNLLFSLALSCLNKAKGKLTNNYSIFVVLAQVSCEILKIFPNLYQIQQFSEKLPKMRRIILWSRLQCQ